MNTQLRVVSFAATVIVALGSFQQNLVTQYCASQPALIGPHGEDYSLAAGNYERSLLQMGVVRQIAERKATLPEGYEHKHRTGEDENERGDGSPADGDAVGEGSDGGGTVLAVGDQGGGDWRGAGVSDWFGGHTGHVVSQSNATKPKALTLSFTQMANDYQPAAWKDDLDRLRAEAQAIKRDLSQAPLDQREFTDSHQLTARLATVNQALAQLSAQGQVAGNPELEAAQATSGWEVSGQGRAPQLAPQRASAQASASLGEADPSEFLTVAAPSQQEPPADPSEFLTSPPSDDALSLAEHLPISDLGYAVEARGRQETSPSLLSSSTVENTRHLTGEAKKMPGFTRPEPKVFSTDRHLDNGAGSARFNARLDGLAEAQLTSGLGHANPSADARTHSRPSAFENKPDYIQFGLYANTLFGLDIKHELFTVDVIMKLQWEDSRVAILVPSGQASLTLTAAEAKDQIWQPGIEFTNRDMGAQRRTAISIEVWSDGRVTRVERSLAVLRHIYTVEHFPFDEQSLDIVVASSVYMAHELELTPTLNMSGVSDNLFEGENYKFLDHYLSASVDADGALTKSRGYMRIMASRRLDKFVIDFLLPTVLCMICSLAVFWLPHTPMFITSRLALSVLILMVFRTFAISGNAELPPGAPYNWYDLLCMNVQLNMGMIICWNIFIETASKGMNCTTTGKAVNAEMKVVAPILACATFGVVFAGAGPNSALNLPTVTVIVGFLFSLSNLIYIGCVSSTLSAERAHNKFLGKKQVQFNES